MDFLPHLDMEMWVQTNTTLFTEALKQLISVSEGIRLRKLHFSSAKMVKALVDSIVPEVPRRGNADGTGQFMNLHLLHTGTPLGVLINMTSSCFERSSFTYCLSLPTHLNVVRVKLICLRLRRIKRRMIIEVV